ncbi:hypothetical protein [Streptomyces sp. NPDC002785]|uniref:hypothetical protein n=1 Tax=Streptomyces sp. NPDC002785 TaxID=3154543 RepID=UPI00331E59E4
MYADAARSLAETGRCRVVICARPEELQDREEQPPSEESAAERIEDQDERETGGGFHDLLKATALTLPAPLQLMRKETWTGTPARTNGQTLRPLQDEATRAWNLHTALYYKSGGTPWRMQRHSSDLATCYVGVSFYRSANGNELHTAVAQVFNERGDGVVVRSGTAQISKTDRQPHLTLPDARQLLLDALTEYRTTHGHQPARIVVHKTSNFTTGEIDGFHEAADMRDIDHVDMLWIQRRGAPHLYRTGQLPPLRGTSVQLDARSLLLYTRGSVPYFRTYPGLVRPPATADPARNARHRSANRQHRHPRPDQDELEQRPARRTRPPHPAHRLPSRFHPQTRPGQGPNRHPLRLLHVELDRRPGRRAFRSFGCGGSGRGGGRSDHPPLPRRGCQRATGRRW